MGAVLMPLGLDSLQSEGPGCTKKFYSRTSVCYVKLDGSCNTTLTQNTEANNNWERSIQVSVIEIQLKFWSDKTDPSNKALLKYKWSENVECTWVGADKGFGYITLIWPCLQDT